MVKHWTSNFIIILAAFASYISAANLPTNTYVTSFFDIKRGQSLSPRSVEYYFHYLQMLLEIDINLIIFGDSVLKKFVWEKRQKHNTFFIETTMDEIRAKWFYKKSEEIRKQRLTWPRFETRGDILFSLKDYNVIMTGKIQCMYDAWRLDPFDSDYLYWIDAGFFHLERKQSMTPQNLLDKLFSIIQPVWINQAYTCCHNRFVGYTNDPSEQYLQRGLDYGEQSIIAHIYGGYKETIPDGRNAMINLVNMHLNNNDMNSDQNYWTLMQIRYPYLIPSNFQSFFVLYNHSLNIRQAAFKNQRPYRYFIVRFKQNGGFNVVNGNVIQKLSSSFSGQNERSILTSKVSVQLEERINLLRDKLNFDKNILTKRILSLILLIVLGIYGIVIVRKAEEQAIIQIEIKYQKFQQLSSIDNE